MSFIGTFLVKRVRYYTIRANDCKENIDTKSYSFFFYFDNGHMVVRMLSFSIFHQFRLSLPKPFIVHGSQAKLHKLWAEWKLDFEKHLNFLNVRDRKQKREVLLKRVGDDVKTYLQVWCEANDLSGYEELVTTLDACFQPEINIHYERYRFNACTRECNEKIEDYFQRLERLAKACKFENVGERLVDHFISDCSSVTLRHILLRELDLTYDRLLQIVCAFEATADDFIVNSDELMLRRQSGS